MFFKQFQNKIFYICKKIRIDEKLFQTSNKNYK